MAVVVPLFYALVDGEEELDVDAAIVKWAEKEEEEEEEEEEIISTVERARE